MIGLPILQAAPDANRLVYLDETDPFYVGRHTARLTTPQWVGEEGVEAVALLSIDDMRSTERYEAFLRPLLDRLKQIDGRAPVSIFANALDPDDPRLVSWLKEGLSIEVHTLSHPCPCLAKGDFAAADQTFDGCVDLLHRIPGNVPVAFRMPCCDSMNSPSPRFFAEIFNWPSSAGQFLAIDTSIMTIFTSADPEVPREWVVEASGQARFGRYLPARTNAQVKVSMGSFTTTVEDYPYPFVVGGLCWEFPPVVPSDWEAQNLHGSNQAATVEDWLAAMDIVVRKQGTFTLIFHPHGWIENTQLADLVNRTVAKHGQRVRFLNFREAADRLSRNLLKGQALRAADGRDNGVRLLDLDADGNQDVIIANESMQVTRRWDPNAGTWREFPFPTRITAGNDPLRSPAVRFGVLEGTGTTVAMMRDGATAGAWILRDDVWEPAPELWNGLSLDGEVPATQRNGQDAGFRLRDVDHDGRCEVLVSNPDQNAVFSWNDEERRWTRRDFGFPEEVSLVDGAGRDNGLRFVDLNGDTYEDMVFSNGESWAVHLFVADPIPGWDWKVGWTRRVKGGSRSAPGAIPAIVREGPQRNNGAWFKDGHLWIQNEDTAHLPDKVDRRSFQDLIAFEAPPPRSPEESLRAIQVRDGFEVRLVAAEPLVKDPVAFDWGEDLRLWVVEMGDYPSGMDGRDKPGGRVVVLDDADDDGRYDTATTFLEELPFPNSIMPWGRGALVCAAPDMLYAEDTDGDGRADLKRVLWTGFRPGNQQHRVNGFEYGLDNWIYAANGESGGTLRGPGVEGSLSLRGHDLRFRPDQGRLELIEGATQYGRHRNDWGDWFGNNNPAWLWHYPIEERSLPRGLPRPPMKHYMAANSTRAVAISPSMARFNWPGLHHTVTSANSPTPYRDDLFGPEFATSMFISEPAHNLVHREVLTPEGVSWSSRRAEGEEESEFLASTDNWFRPITLKTGPDGALYVADMYRLVIEHPEYAMEDMKQQIDLRAGDDRGRIYRVVPKGTPLRRPHSLAGLAGAELAAAMDSPNGWQRDTVQRLMVRGQDRAAADTLRRLARESSLPQVRVQALCTLDGLGEVSPDWLLRVLRDPHPEVRRHAVRIAEAALPGDESRVLIRRLIEMAEDPAVRVRYQLAFTLGQAVSPQVPDALARLAARDAEDAYVRAAVLSGRAKHLAPLADRLMTHEHTARPFASALGERILAERNGEALGMLAQRLQPMDVATPESWQWQATARLVEALAEEGVDWSDFEGGQTASSVAWRRAMEDWHARVLSRAREQVKEADVLDARLASLRILRWRNPRWEQDRALVVSLLDARQAPELQRTALELLSRDADPVVAEQLLARWDVMSPGIKVATIDELLKRPERASWLVEVIESDTIPARLVNTVQRQKLLQHPDPAVRERAAAIFGAAATGRAAVMQAYRDVPRLTGHPDQGAGLFREHCATCHQVRGEGVAVGPDLGTVTGRTTEGLVAAILDPNQAVEAPFVNYTAVTEDGRELSGVLVSETADRVVLKGAGGMEEEVRRSQLKELRGSALSVMPEGFEQMLKPQDMADLVAFLRGAGS